MRAVGVPAKVAQVSPYATPASGITRMIVELSSRLATEGFSMTLWSPGDSSPDSSLRPMGIQLRAPLGRNGELAIRTFIGLVRHRSTFDVVHCHQVHLQTVAALAAAKILGKSSVLTCHVRPPELGAVARFAGSIQAAIATVLATRLVTVSERIRSDFPGRNWTVIPNGVWPAEVSPRREASDKARPSEEGTSGLVFVGRVTRTKGIFTLLEALVVARPRFPSVRLATFGPTDSPAEYASEKRRLGVEDLVVDHGFDPLWRTRISPGQVFVLPSAYEGLPLAMLEAMSLGLPVIGTPVGGVPDILIPNQTGLSIPVGDPHALADAIVWMETHPVERKEMGKNAKRLVTESFRADEMAKRYSRVYREIGRGPAASVG